MKLFLILVAGIINPLFVYAKINTPLPCSDAENAPLIETENMTAKQYYQLGVRLLCDRQIQEQEGLSWFQQLTEAFMEEVDYFLARDVDLEGIQYIKKAAHLGYIPANYLMGIYYLRGKTFQEESNIHWQQIKEVTYLDEAIIYYGNTSHLIQFSFNRPAIVKEAVSLGNMNIFTFTNIPVLYSLKYIQLLMDNINSVSVDRQQEVFDTIDSIKKSTKICVDQLDFYKQIDFPVDFFLLYEELKAKCQTLDAFADVLYELESIRTNKITVMKCEDFLTKESCFKHYGYSKLVTTTNKLVELLVNLLNKENVLVITF